MRGEGACGRKNKQEGPGTVKHRRPPQLKLGRNITATELKENEFLFVLRNQNEATCRRWRGREPSRAPVRAPAVRVGRRGAFRPRGRACRSRISNWRATWWTNISIPGITWAPRSFASFNSRVSGGVVDHIEDITGVDLFVLQRRLATVAHADRRGVDDDIKRKFFQILPFGDPSANSMGQLLGRSGRAIQDVDLAACVP